MLRFLCLKKWICEKGNIAMPSLEGLWMDLAIHLYRVRFVCCTVHKHGKHTNSFASFVFPPSIHNSIGSRRGVVITTQDTGRVGIRPTFVQRTASQPQNYTGLSNRSRCLDHDAKIASHWNVCGQGWETRRSSCPARPESSSHQEPSSNQNTIGKGGSHVTKREDKIGTWVRGD